jgi:uncharacterized membrane protein YebE (DUF533 family)
MNNLESHDIILILVIGLAVFAKIGIIGYMAYKNNKKNKAYMQMLMDMKNKSIADSGQSEQSPL